MVTVLPATLTTPLRAAPEFGAMVNLTVPLPLPVAPLVIAIQAALLDALHEQPASALTATERASPVVGAVKVASESM